MGKELVIVCDSCRKVISNGSYYRAVVNGVRTPHSVTGKAFYFCPDCVEVGCIGNAIKNVKKGKEE